MSKRPAHIKNGSPEKRAKTEIEADACNSLQHVDIKKLMSQTCPSVKNVLLKKDGTKLEVMLNMTPSVKAPQELLGGEITFLGQWEDIQVILLIRADQLSSSSNDNANKHKLQPPFHDAKVYGDILLTRSDDDGMPLDFSMDEYEEFTKREIQPWHVEDQEGKLDLIEEGDEEEDSDGDPEEEDSEDDLDEDDDDAMALLVTRLHDGFVEKYHREPSDEEMSNMVQGLWGSLEESDDDEYAEADDDDNDEAHENGDES